MAGSKLHYVDVGFPEEMYAKIDEMAQGKSKSAVIVNLLRPVLAAQAKTSTVKKAIAPAAADTPAELLRLVNWLQAQLGGDGAWTVVRDLTRKKPTIESYKQWLQGRKKFYDRAGEPSGNRNLLTCLQKMEATLKGKTISATRLLKVARAARSKFDY